MNKQEASKEAERMLRDIHRFCVEHKVYMFAAVDMGDTCTTLGVCDSAFQVQGIVGMLKKDKDAVSILDVSIRVLQSLN